ncbi:hypothetical protein GVAV_002701 [Gurleya vavrai]
MIALRYLSYFNYLILSVLGDTEITVRNINIYSDKNTEIKNECFDSHLLALNIIKENYDLFKSEYHRICVKIIIQDDLNEIYDKNFYKNYIQKIIEKIRSFPIYERKILEKYGMIEKKAKNAQKVFYLHFCIISYRFSSFWNKFLPKHIIHFDSLTFYNCIEPLIFNEDIRLNSIYKNINFNPEVRFLGGLLSFEEINYFKLLEIEMIDFFSTILAKSIVRFFERNSLLRYNKNNIKALKKKQIIDINYYPKKIIDRISYIYEINIEISDFNIWFHYLKLFMIDIINIRNFDCYYIVNFNVFNYVQVFKKIEAIKYHETLNPKYYYFSTFYILKQFFKIIDNRNLINYADECLNEILALLEKKKKTKLPIKILVNLKNNFMSNISTLKNELCFLEKGLSKSCKILRNNKYYLVLDLLWLEAYTFITMIRKFTGVDVILNRFSIDTKIEKSSVFKCDQHVLRLTKYDDKKKIKIYINVSSFKF